MKIRKIAAVCKAAGTAYLIDVPDKTGTVHQWISSGCAAYPVSGIPYLEPENLEPLLEISSESVRIKRTDPPEKISFAHSSDFEVKAEETAISLCLNTKQLLALWDGTETIIIDKVLLGPITAEFDEISFYKRGSELPYIAVKAGLMLVGVIMPIRLTAHERDALDHIARTMLIVASTTAPIEGQVSL